MPLNDSFGNEIPIGKPCLSDTNIDESLFQLQITMFNIAIGLSLEKGYKVRYDKTTKTATINIPDFGEKQLSHN